MKSFLSTALFFFLVSFSISHAWPYRLTDSIDIGVSPVAVYSKSETTYLYAICLGYDANHNGMEDEGDSRPSIWKITIDDWDEFISAHKVMTLDFNSLKFPVRFSFRDSILYLPSKNRILEIDCEKDSLLNSYPTSGDPSDVKYTDNGLMICFPGAAGEVGRVGEYSLPNMEKRWEVPVGINLQEAVYMGNRKFAALCVGPEGANSSEVWVGEVNDADTVPNFRIFEVGKIGNHLVYFGDVQNSEIYGWLYATSYGDHKIAEINLFMNEIDWRITNTAGYNGPRESCVFEGSVFASTYSGDMQYFPGNSGNVGDSISIGGKAEGITAIGIDINKGDAGSVNVYVASPFKLDNTPNTKVYFIQRRYGAVYEPIESAPFTLYPTPTRDNLTVKFDSAPLGTKIEIRDAAGKFVKSAEANEELVTLDLLGVAQGSYFAVITIDGKVWSAPFTVVK